MSRLMTKFYCAGMFLILYLTSDAIADFIDSEALIFPSIFYDDNATEIIVTSTITPIDRGIFFFEFSATLGRRESIKNGMFNLSTIGCFRECFYHSRIV